MPLQATRSAPSVPAPHLLVAAELELVEKKLSSLVQSREPLLNEIANYSQVELDGSYGLRIHSYNAQKILTKVIDNFSKNNIKIESIIINSPSLEEVFLDIINKNKCI